MSRARWLVLLFTSSWAAFAATATAQGCPPTLGSIPGNLEPKDSTPTGNPSLQWTIPGGGGTTPSVWGGGTFCAGQAHTYVFKGSAGGYFRANAGSATCSGPPPVTCGGGYGAQLHATRGALKGNVYRAPTGLPAQVSVTATTPGYSATVASNASGAFQFRSPGPNDWGLLVFCGGNPAPPNNTDCDSPGTAMYTVSAGNAQTSALVTSSKMAEATLVIRDPSAEHPPRCNDPFDTQAGPTMSAMASEPPEPSCPSCKVGAPIDLATGNVFFDQSDAALPGIGTGLVFSRSYNSANLLTGQFSQAFGPGWSHSYDKRLFIPAGTTDVLALRKGNGVAVYYQDTDHDNTFLQSYPWSEASWIEKQGSTYVRRFRQGGSESYDSQKRLAGLTDRNNNTTTLTYDGQNRLATITEPSGRTLTLHYQGPAFVQPDALIGPGSTTLVTYGYTTGRLTSVTYPDSPDDADALPDGGYTFEYTGPGGRLSTVRDLTGRIVEHHEYVTASGPYYGFARTSEISAGPEPDGVERYSVEYQPSKATVRTRRVAGAPEDATVYEFTGAWGQSKVAKVTGPCASCGGGGGESRAWTYDSRGRVKTSTDAAGAVTTYTYDAATGDLLSELRSGAGGLSHLTSYTYDSSGRVLTRTAPNGHVTTWTYATVAGPDTIKDKADAAGRFRVTSFTYQPSGKVWTVTDPRGKTTTFAYHPTGDLQTVTDPLAHASGLVYDVLGRRTAVTNALGQRTETAYNSRGQVVRERRFRGSTPIDTLYAYDQAGRKAWVKDPNLLQTDYTYDSFGRLQYVDQPLVNGARPRTTYDYDLMSNRTGITDSEARPTVFDYDGYNRVRTVTYPGGRVESFTYDAPGRLATRTDRKGIVTTHSYDGFGRLLSKVYSDGLTAAAHYFYDENGDIGFQTRADLGGQRKLTWDYDLAGDVMQERYWHDGSSLTSTLAYTYDLAGNRASVSLDGQNFVTYTRDDAGRLGSLSRGAATFGFSHDDANRRIGMAYPNGVNTTYSYDDLSNLMSIDAVSGPNAVTHAGYTYDDAGSRISKSQIDYSETYEYDSLYRLALVTRDGNTSEEYSYDNVGNRLTSIEHSDWTYNQRNELESYGSTSFTYDLNGNVATKSEVGHSWAYEWSAEGQLTRAIKDGVEVARFTYDPVGRRVEVVTAGTSNNYVYDDEDIIEQRTAGTTLRYVHGQGIDEPLAAENGAGQSSYYHADALGSVLARTNASGTVTLGQAYGAFGQAQSSAAAGFSFTGREWEPETGLYDYRARHFDAESGRFLSEDPVRDRRGQSLYAYVENRPTTLVDPSGRDFSNPTVCEAAARTRYYECEANRGGHCKAKEQAMLAYCNEETHGATEFGKCVATSFLPFFKRSPTKYVKCACDYIPGFKDEYPDACEACGS